VSVNKRDRETIKGIIRELKELGFEIAATRGTARDLFDASIVCETMLKTDEGHPNIIDHLKNGRIDLLINTPMGKRAQKGVESIRSVALTQKVPYTTTTSAAAAALAAIKYLRDGNVGIVSL
jgi:carbamoyl-phosphate synthase large subunit